MGTDIHLYVERRLDDGTWEVVAPVVPKDTLAAYGRYHGEPSPCRGYVKRVGRVCLTIECHEGKVHRPSPIHDEAIVETCPVCRGTGRTLDWDFERDYLLFTVLAGVRDQGVWPIQVTWMEPCDEEDPVCSHECSGTAADRADSFYGEPPDRSAQLQLIEFEHPPCYLTLAELVSYDWEHGVQIDTSIERGARPIWPRLEYFVDWIKEHLVPLQVPHEDPTSVRIVFEFSS